MARVEGDRYAEHQLALFLYWQGNSNRTVAGWLGLSRFNVRNWTSGRCSAYRKPPLVEVIESRTVPEPNTGCLLWTGHTCLGYGRFAQDGKIFAAHRVAWETAHGEIPPGLFVCHKCDTPACCNVDHLFIGTVQENTADMVRKGRGASGLKTNRTIPMAKVRAIRSLRGKPAREIASVVGCSPNTVRAVLREQHWSASHD